MVVFFDSTIKLDNQKFLKKLSRNADSETVISDLFVSCFIEWEVCKPPFASCLSLLVVIMKSAWHWELGNMESKLDPRANELGVLEKIISSSELNFLKLYY